MRTIPKKPIIIVDKFNDKNIIIDQSILEGLGNNTLYEIYADNGDKIIDDSEVFTRIDYSTGKRIDVVLGDEERKKPGKRFVGFFLNTEEITVADEDKLKQLRDDFYERFAQDDEIEYFFVKGKDGKIVYGRRDDPDRLFILEKRPGKSHFLEGKIIYDKYPMPKDDPDADQDYRDGMSPEEKEERRGLKGEYRAEIEKIKEGMKPESLNPIVRDPKSVRIRDTDPKITAEKKKPEPFGTERRILFDTFGLRKGERKEVADTRYLNRVEQYVEQVVDALQNKDKRKAAEIKKQLKLFIKESDSDSRSGTYLKRKTVNRWIIGEKDSRDEKRYVRQIEQYVEQISDAMDHGKNSEAEKIRGQLYSFAEKFDQKSLVFISKEKIDRWIFAYTKPK